MLFFLLTHTFKLGTTGIPGICAAMTVGLADVTRSTKASEALHGMARVAPASDSGQHNRVSQ